MFCLPETVSLFFIVSQDKWINYMMTTFFIIFLSTGSMWWEITSHTTALSLNSSTFIPPSRPTWVLVRFINDQKCCKSTVYVYICVWNSRNLKTMSACLFFFFKLYEMGKNYFKNILPDYSQRVCKMHLAATIYICGKRSESTSKRGFTVYVEWLLQSWFESASTFWSIYHIKHLPSLHSYCISGYV